MRDREMSAGCLFPVFVVLFPLIGCLAFYFLGQSTTLDCTRLESAVINCQKQNHLLGVYPLGAESIGRLQGAWVEEECDDGCTYRVVLQTEQGDVPLTSYLSSGHSSKDEIAGQINMFVYGQEPSLQIKDSAGAIGIIVPVVFILVGPLMLVGWVLKRIR